MERGWSFGRNPTSGSGSSSHYMKCQNRVWLSTVPWSVSELSVNMNPDWEISSALWCKICGAWTQTYHILLSSSCGHPDHDVLPHVPLRRVPAHVQGAGGGIRHLQVLHKAQRPWAETRHRKINPVLGQRFMQLLSSQRLLVSGEMFFRGWTAEK